MTCGPFTTSPAIPQRSTSVEQAVASTDDSASPGSTGRTTITDIAVSAIAVIDTRGGNGVHDFGDSSNRAIGALGERVPGATANRSQGVSAKVDDRDAGASTRVR